MLLRIYQIKIANTSLRGRVVDAWWKFNHSLEMLLAMLQLIFLSIHRLSCCFVSLKKVGSVSDCLGRDLWELLSCKVNICDLNVFLICLLTMPSKNIKQ